LIWEESSLSKTHNRNAFDCGEQGLSVYLKSTSAMRLLDAPLSLLLPFACVLKA
jgi:hypothetical protein